MNHSCPVQQIALEFRELASEGGKSKAGTLSAVAVTDGEKLSG